MNFVLFRDGAYQMNPDCSCSIDTEIFDRLVAEGEAARRSGNSAQCVKYFEEAIELYRGEFMSGVYEEWAKLHAHIIMNNPCDCWRNWQDTALSAGDSSRALQLAQKILREDQLREDIHCIVMQSLAAQGNRGAVKEQYESLRRILRRELDVEPATETQRVYSELLKA